MWKRLLRAHVLATAAQGLTFAAAFLGLFSAIWYLTVVSGGLALVLYVASLLASKRERRTAENQVDRLAGAVGLERVLRETAAALGLGATGKAWRLSLYRLDFASNGSALGEWNLQARAASQRAHELASDLATFSATDGVLRTAISSADQPTGGVDEMPTLPDFAEEPGHWAEMMQAWGWTSADTAGGMRSRSIVGRVFRVGLSVGAGADMTLGLVAESETPGGVRRQALEDNLTRPVFELLFELLRLREEMRSSLTSFAESVS